MKSPRHQPTVWLVDPISHSGMAYSDVGQIDAMRELGASALLAGSDGWMLDPAIIPRLTVFRGTHGDRSQLQKGAAYVVSLMRLLRRIRAARPDVVHWQYSELPLAEVMAMLAIRTMGVRQVYTAHELLPWTSRTHHRWLFGRMYALMDAMIVHNDHQRRELIRRFPVKPERVHLAPLGDYALFASPELPQADARARLGIPAEAPVALFFGTIRPAKGLEVLLRAWQEVASSVPDAILLVTGKLLRGVEKDEIEALIDELGIAHRLQTLFEQVDPEAANAYYRAADVVVLPYHSIGTSGVLRYAYNSARAVIATSVGEHAERVIEGETGYLVQPADPIGMADRLAMALADREKLESMGLSARAYADANLGWLDPSRRLLEVYDSIGRDRR